jgi:hypothetical protein
MQDSLCFCSDVNGLIEEPGFPHPEGRRLFINALKLSWKAVWLHNGNVKPSITVAHSLAKEESYASMSLLLNTFSYTKHYQKLCGDLKVTGL